MVLPIVILRAWASNFSSRARVAIGNNFGLVGVLFGDDAFREQRDHSIAGVERKIMSVAILKIRSRSEPRSRVLCSSS